MNKIEFFFKNITQYPNYSHLNKNKNFLIVQYQNNNYTVFLDECFLPNPTNQEEVTTLRNIIGFLSNNKKYSNFFPGEYSNQYEDATNNKLWEIESDIQTKWNILNKKYYNMTEDINHHLLIQDFLIDSTTLLTNPIFALLINALCQQHKITSDELFIHPKITELIQDLHNFQNDVFINKSILFNKNGNINFKSSFEFSNNELKGHFFELLCNQVLFNNQNYSILADWSSLNNRKKGNIYPDIIALSQLEKEIIIIDSKYYKLAQEVSGKEVFMNHIVIQDLAPTNIPIYNFAIVPKKMDQAFNIERIEKIYDTHVIVVELDIFKTFQDTDTLKKMIDLSIQIMNDSTHKKLIKPQLNVNIQEFIKQYITN